MLRVAAVAVGIVSLCGCATYKIESTNDYEPVSIDSSAELFITRVNDFPEGNHCFEPMLYVLTLGIIPTHCVERFNVGSSDPTQRQETTNETHFTVTYVQGWMALPMSLSGQWQLGYGEDAPVQIKRRVRQEVD